MVTLRSTGCCCRRLVSGGAVKPVRFVFPTLLLLLGLLIMVAGAAIAFAGGSFRGMWTVVAISIAIGFVTTNFGRVALVADEADRDHVLRAAVCAVLHLSFVVMLLFFIGGAASHAAATGSAVLSGDALSIAGLILPLSLLCVAVNLGRFVRLHLRERAENRV